MMIRLKHLTSEHKLAIGSVLGAAFLLTALILAFCDKSRSLSIMLCLFGAATGWLTGILISPDNDDEKSTFSGLAKGFLALGTGFVLAKFDKIIVDSVAEAMKTAAEEFVFRAVLFATCFVIGFLFTLVFRLYGVSVADRKSKLEKNLKRAALIANAELEAELSKLESKIVAGQNRME